MILWLFFRNNTLRYLFIVIIAIMLTVLMSVLTEFTKRNLTYKAWIPFNYSSFPVYFLMYTHQLIGMATSGIVNVACESLICGLLLQICGQLEILEYRLTKLVHGEYIMNDCIRHHNLIFESVFLVIYLFQNFLLFWSRLVNTIVNRSPDKYYCSTEKPLFNRRYAYRVNNMFRKIIALQFAVSMLVVCSNLYRIAMAKDSMTVISLMFYTGAILTQIFIYCWFGNEVKIKV